MRQDTERRNTHDQQPAPPNGDAGMLGASGTEPVTDEFTGGHTAPVGVPTELGADSPTHTEAIPHAAGTASVPTTRDVPGTPGPQNATSENMELGGMPMPGPAEHSDTSQP